MPSLRRALTQMVRAPFRALGLEVVRRSELVQPVIAGAFDARLHNDQASLPPEAKGYLREDNPRLLELRTLYEGLDWPVRASSRWDEKRLGEWLHFGYFRGENMYIWHYRQSEEMAKLYYFTFLQYVRERDHRHLLETLGEDGAFGCWTYEFPPLPVCSRDLLDSVNELLFLDRTAGIFDQVDLRILDIGAGYGRLAHRASQALPGLRSYLCVDAVPESTFLSEFYLGYRNVAPPAKVIALADVVDLEPGQFDLAVNIHSFSECPHAAIAWWVERLAQWRVPRLFVVPNEPEGFLSLERDGQRIDYLGLLEQHGYRLVAEEKAFDDAAVRAVLGVEDRYCLFERDR